MPAKQVKEDVCLVQQLSKGNRSLSRERKASKYYTSATYYEVSEPEWDKRAGRTRLGAGGNRDRILVTYRGINHISKHVKDK